MHTGSAGAFDPARMMFPPEEKEMTSQETQNLYMTNVYRIQNLTEENYLYRQNFQFLTQMFEKQIHRKLYPQVERQVEKTIRQEMPKAEDRVIQEMTKELHTLVKESGVEQLRVLEKEAKEEQKVLLRKIENIYNSSVYVNVQAKNIRNNNVSINGRMENGQRAKGVSDRNTWLRTQIISVLEQKDQQTVKNLTEEILQKVQTKDTSAAIQQTERVYLEQVLEEYAEGKTDRQQTVQHAAEIIERFERRGQTERKVSEWITSGPSALQPMKVQQSEKARSTQLLQWLELAAEGKVPMQLTEQAQHVGMQPQMDAALMEYLIMPEESASVTDPIERIQNKSAEQVQRPAAQPQISQQSTVQSQLTREQTSQSQSPQSQVWTTQTMMSLQHPTSSTSPTAKAMESHVADEAIRQKTDTAPMEHLTTSEESAEQRSQAVMNQAVQSQSSQAKSGQPQVWTQMSMSSPKSVSPAAKAMEDHLAEELIRQRTEVAPMEHLTMPENDAETQSVKNQAAQGQSSQAKAEQPQAWTVQSLQASQHSASPAAKAMESHPAEEVIRQRTEVTPMEHLTMLDESTAQSQSARNQAAQSQSSQAKTEQPQVWTTQTLLSLQHQTSSTSPAARAMESHPTEEVIRQRSDMTPMEHLPEQVQRFTPVQMLPQQSSDMVEAMPQAQMFPQMQQQPPEVPQAATMRQSSRRQPMTMPHPQPYMMEAAPIIYAEEHKPATDPGETQVIRKQIREITEHIDEVKKTVAVERQVLTEQQKESIRQMIRSTPSLLTEGEMAVLMKQKVETEVLRKMDESMQQMTNRVYRRIEEKLKTERERRGRI